MLNRVDGLRPLAGGVLEPCRLDLIFWLTAFLLLFGCRRESITQSLVVIGSLVVVLVADQKSFEG